MKKYRPKKNLGTETCRFCGKTFTKNREGQIYCSPKHRASFHNAVTLECQRRMKALVIREMEATPESD